MTMMSALVASPSRIAVDRYRAVTRSARVAQPSSRSLPPAALDAAPRRVRAGAMTGAQMSGEGGPGLPWVNGEGCTAAVLHWCVGGTLRKELLGAGMHRFA